MRCRIEQLIILIAIVTLVGHVDDARSQTATQKIDSTKVKKNALDVSQPNSKTQATLRNDEEIELAEINIEAVVEKPSVSIIPKRIEAELTEMEFIDRSFEKELKMAPNQPMMLDDRLFVPQKIENLKQKLIEKKKEEKK